jgi:hypothetical protein
MPDTRQQRWTLRRDRLFGCVSGSGKTSQTDLDRGSATCWRAASYARDCAVSCQRIERHSRRIDASLGRDLNRVCVNFVFSALSFRENAGCGNLAKKCHLQR